MVCVKTKTGFEKKVKSITGLSGCLLMLLFACSISGLNTVQAQSDTRGWQHSTVSAVTQQGESVELYKASYALLIGASNYTTWSSLPSIPSELNEVQETLEAQQFQVERLVDPDSEALEEGIESFINEYGYDKENRLLIFFSGHGHSIEDKGFILPIDTPLPDDNQAFRRKAVPMTQVLAWARDIESKHVLFLFDSCFSGSVFTSKSIPSVNERYIRKATSEPVRQFITAGGEHDEVPSKSTFTPLLVKALQGEGDLNNDGFVTGSELGVHLSQQVPRYLDQTPQYGKIRDYALSQGDFVFVLDKPDASSGTNKDKSNRTKVAQRSINNRESDMELELELELWRSAKEFGGQDDYKAYLQTYPQGRFAGIAKNRLGISNITENDELWEEVGEVTNVTLNTQPAKVLKKSEDDWTEVPVALEALESPEDNWAEVPSEPSKSVDTDWIEIK